MNISDVLLYDLRGNDPADTNQDAHNQKIDCMTRDCESLIVSTSLDERSNILQAGSPFVSATCIVDDMDIAWKDRETAFGLR